MTTLDNRARSVVPETAASILAAAEGLVPILRARSEEIESGRRLPADIVELLRGAGVFRMGFAEDFGGPGLTATEQTRVVEVLATGNTSAAWCAMVGMDTGLFAEYLEPAVVPKMFPSLDMVTAGMLFPAGRAERVPGGYRVSGRWSFGSGITHADWISAGAFTCTGGEVETDAEGRPDWRVMLVRRGEAVIVDNWYSTGLAGSGSHDYTLDDVFVPEERTFSFARPRRTAGPLSTPDLQMRKMAGVAIGTARAALDHVRDIACERVFPRTGSPWKDDYRVQFTLGECEMDFAVARRALYRTLQHRWDRLASGVLLEEFTSQERVDTMLARLGAFRTARSIVRRLYDLLATTAIRKTSPLDGWLRDTETMCQHTVAQDQILQSAGAFLTGGRPKFPLALGITDQSLPVSVRKGEKA